MLYYWYKLWIFQSRWWNRQYYFYYRRLRILKCFNDDLQFFFVGAVQCIMNFYKSSFNYLLYLKMSLITVRNLNFYHTNISCASFFFNNLKFAIYNNFTFKNSRPQFFKFGSYRPVLNLRYRQFIYARRQRLTLYTNLRGIKINIRCRHLLNLLDQNFYQATSIKLWHILQYSNLIPDISLLKSLLAGGYIFLNGYICLNFNNHVLVGNCVQLAVDANFLFYIYRKLIYNYTKGLRRRQHVKINFLYYKDLLYNTKLLNTPLFVELDYTALTCFYLYATANKYIWSWNYVQFVLWRFGLYYNWGFKY